MREMRHLRLWHPIAVTGLALVAIAAQGCSDDDNKTTGSTSTSASSSGSGGTGGAGGEGGAGGTGGTGGTGGGMNSVTPAANGATFRHPFDATPDPAGQMVYFTGLHITPTDPVGVPAIFKANLDGTGTTTVMVSGDPLVMPVNIATSSDGNTLYITDTGADDGTGDAGRIFSLANDASVPAPLTAADNYRPHGLEIRSDGTKDILYFAGTDPATGEKGLFKVAADGSGSVTAVAKGSPFVDPSGVTIDGDGIAYVCDTVQDEAGLASIVSVTPAGVTKVIATDIRAGYPCGVSLTADETRVLVSSHDPATGTSAVSIVEIATQNISLFTMGVSQEIESGGIHAAKGTKNVYAWAGVTAGANGAGTIYKVTLY